MSEQVDQSRWSEYYRRLQGTPPRETLIKALDLFEAESPSDKPRLAIDLGCGVGQDTFELLHRGWKVLAIDKESEAIQLLEGHTPDSFREQLRTQVSAFEQITELPQSDLINASFSLPFCSPEYFPSLWEIILGSLSPGGRLAGQLFGVQDSWAHNIHLNFHTQDHIRQLLAPLVTEYFTEENQDGADALGRPKHWHIFSFVAQRR